MSEPENFLTRWSRRKRVAEKPDEALPNPPNQGPPAAESRKIEPEAPPAGSKPEFDPASLPSLDSIGAQTDIRAFLQAGVPSDLRLAALRRVWSADPTILNFKGLADYDWDFTAPNSMMGFGELDPGTDVKKMLAQVFGETPRQAEPATEIPPGKEAVPPAVNSEITRISQIETTTGDEMLQREKNIVPRDSEAEPDGQVADAPGKRHGRALPQ
jgi:Protein of unknown function (DUF3306)